MTVGLWYMLIPLQHSMTVKTQCDQGFQSLTPQSIDGSSPSLMSLNTKLLECNGEHFKDLLL